MLTEPILSHESEYPFPVVPTVLKLAGQGTSDSADSRARLVLYEPAHSGSITHLVDTIDRHHIGPMRSEAKIERVVRQHHNATVMCLVNHVTLLHQALNASLLLDVQCESAPSFK
ncbi:hypothetical protein M8J77_019718 [Diaphorina citri]|nr:hypothetical protein M8J77_019718 [Diaphorina citri]